MTINPTAVWRIRAGGSDTNGGGYDAAISGTLSTTLNGGITSSQTTITVASASGWPSSGDFYARIGPVGGEPAGNGTSGFSEVVQVTGGQGTTTWTVTRGALGTTGLAQASGVVVDNSLAQCNTAVGSGTVGTSTASTTFVDATFNGFNSTHVGLAILLASGTGTTPGVYFIQSISSSSTVVLDRASGTYTAGVWAMGGAWATFQNQVNHYPVANNNIFVRGSGSNTPSPGSPDYTHAAFTLSSGANSVCYTGENGRPGLTGTVNKFATSENLANWTNFYFIGNSTGLTTVLTAGNSNVFNNCAFDQNGFDQSMITSAAGATFINCEMFNSGSSPATHVNNFFVTTAASGPLIKSCNIHDTSAGLLSSDFNTFVVMDSILSNCGADVISLINIPSGVIVTGNTFDNGVGNGITISTSAGALTGVIITNNILSNFSQSGKAAINNTATTQVVADLIRSLVDYNVFYNNTANYTAMTAGPHDVDLVTSPYVAQSTENYTLTSAATNLLAGTGYLGVAFPQSLSGKTATVRSYVSPGAVQPTTAIASSGIRTNPSLAGAAQ